MSVCSRCGAQFGCAMVVQDSGCPQPDGGRPQTEAVAPRTADDQPYWCTLLPTIATVPDAAGACWCRACLQRHVDSHQRVLARAGPGPGSGVGPGPEPDPVS